MASPGRSRAILQRYTFEFELGLWTFGTTQVVKDRRTGELKTCKSVSKTLVQDLETTCSRLARLRELDHPHVNRVVDVLEDYDNIFIISDRCDGGDLNDWMEQLDEQHWLQEEVIAAYISQALVALAYCHAKRVYHYDLGPGSVMLTSRLPDARVMLSDFGVQAVLDPDNQLARRNPSAYMAPELVSASGRVLGGGAPDVWSIGAIAHLLLVGHEPCVESAWDLSAGNFLLGAREGGEWASRSSASRDFVQRLLQPAGHRPTAARMLQHPWLRNTVIPRVVRGRPGHEDLQQRFLCYMAAVLLVPALLPHGDFCQLRAGFARQDDDYDGLVLRPAARQLLQEHSRRTATPERFGPDQLEDALEIADVKGTGVFDQCSTAVAAVLAQRLAGSFAVPAEGPSRAAELAPLLVQRFYEVYGKRGQPTVDATRLALQLRNATGRDLEMHCGVDYDEVLAAFGENEALDSQALMACLSAHAGRGTPLSYAPDEEPSLAREDTGSSWEPLDGLNHLLGGALESCGFLPDLKRRWLFRKLMDIHCAECISVG